MSARILAFQPVVHSCQELPTAGYLPEMAAPKVTVNGELSEPTFWRSKRLYPEDLYATDYEDAQVLKVLTLLKSAQSYLGDALAINPDDNYIGHDTQIMSARLVIESIFSFRSIGDGFASVVNGINLALSNAETTTLTRGQINVLIGATEKLRRGPFLSFDSAMSILDDLEYHDLDIEPSGMNELIPLDYDESVYRNDSLNGSSPKDPQSADPCDQEDSKCQLFETPLLLHQGV